MYECKAAIVHKAIALVDSHWAIASLVARSDD
jgi:hypothetical protein